jgi:long-chain acyl-CoA synthetase
MSLFAENSYRWLIADQGIMAAGAAAAVRGSKSSADELFHILTHSDSVALVVENLQLYNKIAARLKGNDVIKFVIVLWASKDNLEDSKVQADYPIYSFEELVASGKTSRQALAAVANSGESVQYDVTRPDDVATLVYTSGTTGSPKAVMLTHANLLHQIVHLGSVLQPEPGDRFLSLLPPWHMYERSAEYFALSRGVTQVYTSVKYLKEDLVRYTPDYFVSVPLVFDMLYSGVQKQLTAGSKIQKQVGLTLLDLSLKFVDFKRIQEGRDVSKARESYSQVDATKEWIMAMFGGFLLLTFHLLAQKLVYSKVLASIGIKKAAISGGGSLPPYVDKFFEAIGITLLNGYGLTETAPVVACRLPSNNVLGTVGGAIVETEMKVVDPETGNIVPPGIKGSVKVRGPQIMKGYYKNPTATSKAIDTEGWFETGDLGWEVPHSTVGPARMCGGLFVLDGRAKDTIVLSNGENIEPQEIEEAILQSKLIQNVMLVGQDQRRLGAIVVANKEELQAAVKELKQSKGDTSEISKDDSKCVIHQEMNRILANSSWPVGPFVLVDEDFTVENGLLTPTMKVRREQVASRFQDEINTLFKVNKDI